MTDPARRPTFEKSPPELVERFGRVVAERAALQRRPMFGNPSAFVNGNLATGLFADGWFVRLPEDEAAELLAVEGARPFEPMPGRPMRGYVVLPVAIVSDRTALEAWIDRAIAHAETLPPKPGAG